MNNTEVLNEYFIWEEKNLIEQKNNCLNNNESVHYDTITETKNDSIKNDWRDITDPKLRKKITDRARYIANKDKLNVQSKNWRNANKDKIKEQKKAYWEANKDKLKQQKKAYRDANKDRIKLQNKTYREVNKDKIKVYHEVNKDKKNKRNRERKKNDIQYKLSDNLRTRLYHAINNNQKVGSAVRDLGCTIDELKTYLESKFQPGMNWDNWTIDGWHIDHIKPLSSFDLSDRKQMLEACHYTNLQPLWSKDNLTKSDKIDHPSIYQ